MMLLQVVTAHGLPHWSPFAIAVGFVLGVLVGGLLVGSFALWLQSQGQPVWTELAELPDPAAHPTLRERLDREPRSPVEDALIDAVDALRAPTNSRAEAAQPWIQ